MVHVHYAPVAVDLSAHRHAASLHRLLRQLDGEVVVVPCGISHQMEGARAHLQRRRWNNIEVARAEILKHLFASVELAFAGKQRNMRIKTGAERAGICPIEGRYTAVEIALDLPDLRIL